MMREEQEQVTKKLAFVKNLFICATARCDSMLGMRKGQEKNKIAVLFLLSFNVKPSKLEGKILGFTGERLQDRTRYRTQQTAIVIVFTK